MNKSRIFVLAAALALGLATAFFALAAASYAPQQQVLCVNATGTGCGPDATGGCFSSIQAAIDAAAPTDIIRIAAGTYTSPGENVLALKGKPL